MRLLGDEVFFFVGNLHNHFPKTTLFLIGILPIHRPCLDLYDDLLSFPNS